MIVRMSEMVAYPEAHQELLGWVCDTAVPAVERHMGHIRSEVFTSPDHRIVVISRWRSTPLPLPEPSRHLLAGPPRSWDFSPVDR